jgi:hypothetical protein
MNNIGYEATIEKYNKACEELEALKKQDDKFIEDIKFFQNACNEYQLQIEKLIELNRQLANENFQHGEEIISLENIINKRLSNGKVD